jgi:hypothetical protein
MHRWAQLRGLRGVVLGVVGGGVYALVALGRSPVGKEWSWSVGQRGQSYVGG